MANLIYSVITSLDGYIADETGNFDWSVPDHEVHAFANDLQRQIGTNLYGRRLYEVMSWWETIDDDDPVMRDFAEVWRAADKIVYSTTLTEVSSARTRIEREFDPDAVAALVAGAASNVLIGGADLAAHAFRAGLIDEVHVLVSPVIVGGGTRALPDGVTLELELVDERRFGNGVVYTRYVKKR